MMSGISGFIKALATASRFMPGSVATWGTMTAWSDIRRGGIHRTLRSGLLRGHTRLSFEMMWSPFSAAVTKRMWSPFSAAVTLQRGVCPRSAKG